MSWKENLNNLNICCNRYNIIIGLSILILIRFFRLIFLKISSIFVNNAALIGIGYNKYGSSGILSLSLL